LSTGVQVGGIVPQGSPSLLASGLLVLRSTSLKRGAKENGIAVGARQRGANRSGAKIGGKAEKCLGLARGKNEKRQPGRRGRKGGSRRAYGCLILSKWVPGVESLGGA